MAFRLFLDGFSMVSFVSSIRLPAEHSSWNNEKEQKHFLAVFAVGQKAVQQPQCGKSAHQHVNG
jgi:hypothetical protein